MKINGYSIENLNATLVSFVDSPPGIVSRFFVNDMNLIGYGRSVLPKPKTLKLVFENENDISFFVSLLMGRVSIEENEYVFEGFPIERDSLIYNHIGGNVYEVEANLLVIKKSFLIKRTLNVGNNLFEVHGTYPCPCRYIVTALENCNAKIDGHELNKLTKGKIYVLDGITKTMICDGINMMNNVKLKNGRFPYLNLGLNSINIIGSVEVSLEYNLIWL